MQWEKTSVFSHCIELLFPICLQLASKLQFQMSFAMKALSFEQNFPISFVICIEPHISNLFFKFGELQFPALSAIVMNCNFLSLLQLH